MLYTNGYDVIMRHQIKPARKTALAFVVEVTEPFECKTMEGLVAGKAGDYLAVGVNNEVWPIDKSVFEQSYEIVQDEDAVKEKIKKILLTTIE